MGGEIVGIKGGADAVHDLVGRNEGRGADQVG